MEEKPKKDEEKGIKKRKRACILAIVLFFFFSVLLVQFYKIQIIEGDYWEKIAQRQHFFIVNEPFHRGTFFSHSALRLWHPPSTRQLVVDVQKFHLHIDPQSIPLPLRQQISDKLIEFLAIPANKRAAFILQFFRRSRNRQLAAWLEIEKKELISSWWHPFAKKNKIASNSLFFVGDYQRSYPYGSLLGQVLHTVRPLKESSTRQVAATGGMEQSCDAYLKGRPGKRRLKRSPRHAFETGEVIESPCHGADIYLTIDHFIQTIMEEELASGVANCKAKGGWAIMMDPFSGEVLALAQYPLFNPAEASHFFNDKNLLEHTRIKPITDALEPGSVMKAFTAAAALYANECAAKSGEAPLFDPEAKMPTHSGKFPGRSLPLRDGLFYKFMNLDIAIQKSANIYMARLAELVVGRYGAEWYGNFLRSCFGFGTPTGIELPAEGAGMVPRPGKKHSNGALEWSASTPSGLAIGYNIQMTPIQLVRAYSVIANGGYLVKPTLIRKIVRELPDGLKKVELDNSAEGRKRLFPAVLSSSITKRLVHALKFPTKTGGSSWRADVLGYTEAGKSATAKKIVGGKYLDIYRASFIGFAPASNPSFVLLVTMDEPEYRFIPGVGKNHNGGVCSAPVFKAIAQRTLQYLGEAYDDADKNDWLAETKLLQKKCAEWNK